MPSNQKSEGLQSLAQVSSPRHYGGKAIGLATLIRIGMRVPPGLVFSGQLAQAIADSPDHISSQIVKEIFETLRSPLVVRSSGIGEDDVEGSFAGLHMSILNVRTDEQLLSAIRKVEESSYSNASIAYRMKLGLTRTAETAVIVQELIDAEVSGVLFTKNPISGSSELILEAAWGLGQSVVGGEVTPDRFRMTYSGALLETIPGNKDQAYHPAREGGIERLEISPEKALAPCLTAPMLEELAKVARVCMEKIGPLLDLEWAFANGSLFLLQCRPITTLRSRGAWPE